LTGDTLLDDFVAVYVHELLRDAGEEGGAHICDFGALASSGEKLI